MFLRSPGKRVPLWWHTGPLDFNIGEAEPSSWPVRVHSQPHRGTVFKRGEAGGIACPLKALLFFQRGLGLVLPHPHGVPHNHL